jgi:L,D-peptidoglycan transpeptidase YkuD (ErfK/YbiS/YcfS/YnhG family)
VVSTAGVVAAVAAGAASVVIFAAAQPRGGHDEPTGLPGPSTAVRRPPVAVAAEPSSSRLPVSPPVRAAPPRRSSTPSRYRAPSTSTPAPTHVAGRPSRPGPTRAAATPALPRGQALPLGYSTGSASRVITVVASSIRGTTARLQAWTKVAGGWRPYGAQVTAHVGAQGLTTRPSESNSATPIGSFTLTQAFGALADPGTGLPYFRTDPADWWISQPGRLYNTHQHCASGCAFTQGDPNEHLRYETPYYNYAVVIDYNRFPVRQGGGSAFFLHVTDGAATAGCVAIAQDRLVTLMRWLTPAAHPRILIGVA